MRFSKKELQLAQSANFELSLKYMEAVRDGYDVIIEPPKDSIEISTSARVLNSGNWGYDFLNLDFIKSQYYDKGIVPERKIIYVVIDTMAYPVHKALIPYSVDKKYCFDFTEDRDGVDDHGHGHHCGGIIMGNVANYNLGVAHIKGYKTKDLLMGQKGLSSKGAGASAWLRDSILKSLDICKTEFPDYTPVFSLSWGASQEAKLITSALDQVVAAGGFVCASSGNDGSNSLKWPSAHKSCMANGAHDPSGQKSYFSQYGSKLFSIGPGRNVWSCNKVDGQYMSWSGTSMGNPHVAGMVGHYLKFHPEIVTQDQLILSIDDKFKDAGSPGKDDLYGYGYPVADYILKDITPPKDGPKEPPKDDPEPPKDDPKEPPKDNPDVPKTRNKRILHLDFEGSWDLSWRVSASNVRKHEVVEANIFEVEQNKTMLLTSVEVDVKTSLYFDDVYDWIDRSITRAFTRVVMTAPKVFDSYDVFHFYGKYLNIKFKQYNIDAKVKSFKGKDSAGRLVEIKY